MSRLNLDYLFKDKVTGDPTALSDYDTLDIESCISAIFGLKRKKTGQ